MDNTKKFDSLGASNAWGQTHRLTWYSNFWKHCEYDPVAGLKAKAGDDVEYYVTEVGETLQLFYREKKGETKNEFLHKKRR